MALPLHLLALARIATFVENKPEDVPKALIDATRIARLITQDSTMAPYVELRCLRQIRLFAREIADPVLLDTLQQSLDALGIPFPEPIQLLEPIWRAIDEEVVGRHLKNRSSIFSRIKLMGNQLEADKVIKNKDRYEQLAAGPLPALERWTHDNPGKLDMRMIYFITLAVEMNANYLATRLVIAIERYKVDHGTYPHELAELSPTYLPEIPTDPTTNGPFTYRCTDTGYQLDIAKPASVDAALELAKIDGRYSNLLKAIEVTKDGEVSGEFEDYGIWQTNEYYGHTDIPRGYWVYVYPNWYIFETEN